MGRKNKRYVKTLHQQAYDRLIGMQAFGTSKKSAIKSGTAKGKIFSFSTYKSYWKHIKYFLRWVTQEHPDCTTLKNARKYVPVWLQYRTIQTNTNDKKLSAWTLQLEAAALYKLYGIESDSPERITLPKRCRTDIKRSRYITERDLHFSTQKNAEFIQFCQGTGLRRKGIQSIRGKDLLTRAQIEEKIKELETVPPECRNASAEKILKLYKDTRLFRNPSPLYFIYCKEKGGRERISPIVGSNIDAIVNRFRNTQPNDKVWGNVPVNADVHSYRSDYATTVYQMYARPTHTLPYDSINKGSGHTYQSGVYTCRKDRAGKKLDRHAMLIASKALGHNRIDIIANNYLRNN